MNFVRQLDIFRVQNIESFEYFLTRLLRQAFSSRVSFFIIQKCLRISVGVAGLAVLAFSYGCGQAPQVGESPPPAGDEKTAIANPQSADVTAALPTDEPLPAARSTARGAPDPLASIPPVKPSAEAVQPAVGAAPPMEDFDRKPRPEEAGDVKVRSNPMDSFGGKTGATATAAGGKSDNQGPPKQRQTLGLPQISVIDKLLAAEMALGPALKRKGEADWAAEYKALYNTNKVDATPGNLSPSRPVVSMALGVKASDGVLALKGRDIEALNNCAEQIEKLAAKLDVPGRHLERAAMVKHHAKQQHWIEAFMELGFLQRDVSRNLENNPEQKDDAMLIVVGGWLQGGRCVTHLILDHYTPESSNILREPKLVQVMVQEMNKIPDKYKTDPVVREVLKFLPEAQKLVDVGIRDAVPIESVKALHKGFESLVKMIVKPVQPNP